MMISANDFYRAAQRPVITDLLQEQLVRRWLCDKRIVTFTAKGNPTKALIDSWGEAMLQTTTTWSPDMPYMSLHHLPITRNLLPYVQDWLDWVESCNSHLYGRMAVVAPVEIADLLRDVIEHPTLDTEVFESYSDALAWLKQ